LLLQNASEPHGQPRYGNGSIEPFDSLWLAKTPSATCVLRRWL
jgi:hypothetical protein